MEAREAQEELAAALAKRDPEACSLRHTLAWTGTAAVCGRTGLRYDQCCGALYASAPAPRAALAKKGAEQK
jgi:hypothetical protein